jgi:mono-ADP-ribosyltransferase sirtuin 6
LHISELHGNSNIEQCVSCGKEYLRGIEISAFFSFSFCFVTFSRCYNFIHLTDFDASAAYQYSVHDHRTGRQCFLCGGILVDSIINFGIPEIFVLFCFVSPLLSC